MQQTLQQTPQQTLQQTLQQMRLILTRRSLESSQNTKRLTTHLFLREFADVMHPVTTTRRALDAVVQKNVSRCKNHAPDAATDVVVLATDAVVLSVQ
jgi:DNA-binding cell septation regulator SpoVG